MSTSIERISEPDADALALHLAQDVAAVLRSAVAERGGATLVVSGGSTPLPMFQRLAQESDVPWSKVQVTLADERAVPPDHADSNEGFVHKNLLTGTAAVASFVSMLPAGLPSLDRLDEVSGRIDAMGSPFDVVLLGMGGDGHTASLFPDAPELEDAMASTTSVVALNPPSVSQARLSLSASRLIDTRHLWLHISGASKAQVLETALADGTLPIARVLKHAASGSAHRAIYLTS